MSNKRYSAGAPVLLALVTLFWGPASVIAQDDAARLQQAIELFQGGDYVAAQETLVGIDRAQLDSSDQTLRDDYLNRVQVALTMVEKALRDLEDAETAIAEGETAQAESLLQGVLDNEYAADALHRSARALLRDLPGSSGTQPPADAPAPQIDLQNGQRAGALTEQAEEAVLAGRYDEARALFDAAILAVPGYPEAVEGLRRLLEHQRSVGGAETESLIDSIRRQSDINWQRTVTQYRDVERVIRDHVDQQRFEEAVRMLVRARQIVVAGRQFADPVTKYESLYDELETLETFARAQERDYNELRKAEIADEVAQQRQRRLHEIEEKRSRQVEALMEQVIQHRKDGDLSAAINVLRQVTVIAPKYRPARWMMTNLEDIRHYARAGKMRKARSEETRKVLDETEEAMIPWAETLRFPDDWAERSARPGRSARKGSVRNSRLIGALDTPIPVDFRDDPFDQVIERLAENHRINVIVNWADLKRVGVERTIPIDLDLPQEITLKSALTEVLEQAGGGLTELGFDITADAIKIATRETLDKNTEVVMYDINDLLHKVPNFTNAPITDLAQSNAEARRQQVAVPVRPWGTAEEDDDEPDEDPSRTERVRRVIELIESTIMPGSWGDSEDAVGHIEEFNGQLVVTQSSAGQAQVGDLLGQLRQQRAIQIAVESRFITVTSNFLEEMGIDLDIVLNSGNAGYDFVPTGGNQVLRDPVLGQNLLLPRTFSRLGYTPAVPAAGVGLATTPQGGVAQPFGQTQFIPQQGGGFGSRATPVPIINKVSSFTDVLGLASDIPGTFAGSDIGSAFSLFGSVLDNIQVDFLIRATQADGRSNVVTAPHLILFNGQRSFVAVTTQSNYITTLNPVVGTNAVAVQPVPGTVNSGAVLDVIATVSADRRYVTMTLRPGLQRLIRMDRFEFSGGAAGGGFGGGAAGTAFLQLPTVSVQVVQTTVSVPDGGTLLIGGQKLATETEVEAGVPILSKIPILKRLYSSRTLVRDEQTLLIMVRPRILIQSEQEELAFPSFGS